jgi:glucokinase
MVIVADGLPCQGACSGRGHLEAYCSGRAADKLAKELVGPTASAYDLVRGHHPVLQDIGHYLGVAIGSLVNIFGATRVVIGGGFGIAAFDLVLPAIREVLEAEALPGARGLRIEQAQLGEEAGVVGAGLIAFDALA